nr:hypothetical protein [Tanacetum cinerariifolium]
ESRKRGHDGVDANAPPKSLRRDHVDLRPSGSSYWGKSLAAMQLCLASNVFVSEGAPANVSDPDPLSFADAPSRHPVDVAQSSPSVVAAEDPESKNASSPTKVGSSRSVYRPEWGVTNGNLLDTPEACQDLVDHVAPPGYFFELRYMRNEDFLRQYNVNLARQVALRPFLRTARALIDVHGEEMILRDGDEKLTLNMKQDTASYSNHPHIDSFNDIHPHFDDDPLSGSTTYSANSLLEEFADELALITYPSDYDDTLTCDIESDIREIEFLLSQGKDFDFKDSIDQPDLANLDDLFVDPTPEMDDELPSPDNEDKVFNPEILSHKKSVSIITRFAQENKLAVSFASSLFEDFDPPFYELLVFKEVPNSMRLLPFSFENKEKVFKPGIYTFEKVKESSRKGQNQIKTGQKREA